MSDVTRILDRVQQGDPKAAEELLPLVYNELRRLAAHKMAQEKAGHTLQAISSGADAIISSAPPRRPCMFAGLKVAEIATILHCSDKTVQRHWDFACW